MRLIGAIEQPYQWGQSIVCPQCCVLLQSGPQAGAVEPQPAVVQVYVERPSRKRSISGLGIAALVVGCLALMVAITALVATRMGRPVVMAPRTEPDESSPPPAKKSIVPEAPASDVAPPQIRHLPAIDPSLKRDVNQEDEVRDCYGDPDLEGSNEDIKPKPAAITKRLVYDPEHLLIVMAPNDDAGKYYTGPVTAWAITAYLDSRDNTPLSREEAEKRLVMRVPKHNRSSTGQ